MTLRCYCIIGIAAAIGALPAFATADTTLDRVVAVVDTEVILASELGRRLAGAGEKNADVRKVLGAMIDERLLVQVARDRFLQPPDEEIDNAIAEVKAVNKLSDKQLEQHLDEAGYTLEEYRVDVERQIMALKVIVIDVTVDHVSGTPDEARAARQRYIDDLRALAYIDIRLGAKP